MYGNSNLNLEEKAPVDFITEPGIYTGIIESVTQGTHPATGSPVIHFLLKADDGRTHDYFEFEQTDVNKIGNQQNRLAVILSRFVAKDQVERSFQNVNSFDALGKWVINTLGNTFKGVKIVFKLVANVYNPEKPRVVVPLYKGAIARADAAKDLKFSKKELEDNKRFEELIKLKYSSNGQAEKTESVSQQASSMDEPNTDDYDDNPVF